MKINQAFLQLQSTVGNQAARMITDGREKISKFYVLWGIHRLKRGMPIAKIIHQKWFYGYKFYTNMYTLDPRPDSETLVETVIKETAAGARILDMGTGTGCLIISIVKNIPGASGIAIDKSFLAILVAKKNIKNLGVADKITVHQKTFNSNLKFGKFDVIISNPPYIAAGDLRVNRGALFDPKMALYARKNGLSAYISIAKNSHKYLKPGGKIYLEVGDNQGDFVADIFIKNNWEFLRAEKDLSGKERVFCFKFNS